MTKWNGYIRTFPKPVKWFTGIFLVILSFGFSSGIKFVDFTTHITPQGIEESYLGNEDNEEAEIMKYEKTQQEMLTMLHTHVMSLSLLFFITGSLVFLTKASLKLKRILAIEPLLSIIFTFGGIYLMWTGITWMKYVILISGILMTLCFTGGVLLVLWNLIQKPISNSSP